MERLVIDLSWKSAQTERNTYTLVETEHVMPWYNGDYPPSYKNQPADIRNKATEIANELLLHGAPEGVAIATCHST